MSKFGLGRVVKGYIETLRYGREGGVNWADVVIQIVIPIICGVLLAIFGGPVLSWGKSMLSNAVVAVSIVSALMCALAVMVFQLRVQIGNANARHLNPAECKFIDELFADVLWSILVGFAATLFMISAGAESGDFYLVRRICSGISLAALMNFAMVVCMCVKRMDVAYKVFSKQKDQ